MSENYYDTLGVPRNASTDQIKKAYRKIAVKFHPDKKPGNKVAEDIYHRATEAYEVLKDPEKRKKYDSKFSWSKNTKRKPLKRRGTDLRVSVKVKREDIVKGIERIIVIKRQGLCKSCAGTGSEERKTKKCTYCAGTGLAGFSLALGERRKCRYCKGAGIIPLGKKCTTCRGTALAPETIRRKIQIHPLMANSTVLLELGNHRFAGIPGNLFIDLDIIEDPRFKVDRLDVKAKVTISPAQAVLGDKIRISVFGKELTLKIPSGINNGDKIEMSDGGITYEGKTGRFKATVFINIPLILSDDEKELYQKLLQIEKEKPWPRIMNF